MTMCTAVTYKTRDFYFGRTLDYDVFYPSQVTVTPRKFPLTFRHAAPMERHYAIIGMAWVSGEYPLYFDGVNERGVGMAGLNCVGNAVYQKPMPGKDNIAQFEFIPWVLGNCASVRETRALLKRINLTDTPFSKELPPAQLHWLIADREEAVVVEAVKEGLRVYEDPIGVLTNNPPFEEQVFNLNNFMHLSSKDPENRFSPRLSLEAYSRGMGALGRPGDLSSQSRFVRASFVKLNSVSGEGEKESVNQFFHILGSVEQQRGCCDVGNGAHEITIYTSCCNADRGIYYYTTYENHQITGVDMHGEDLDGRRLVRYPLAAEEQIQMQNRMYREP